MVFYVNVIQYKAQRHSHCLLTYLISVHAPVHEVRSNEEIKQSYGQNHINSPKKNNSESIQKETPKLPGVNYFYCPPQQIVASRAVASQRVLQIMSPGHSDLHTLVCLIKCKFSLALRRWQTVPQSDDVGCHRYARVTSPGGRYV